jgi:hypothetical protein
LLILTALGVNVVPIFVEAAHAIASIAADIVAMVLNILGHTTGTVVSAAGKGVEIVGKGVEVAGKGIGDIGEDVTEVIDKYKDGKEKRDNKRDEKERNEKERNEKEKDDGDDDKDKMNKHPEFVDVTIPDSGRKIRVEDALSKRPNYQPGQISNNPLASDYGSTGKQKWCLAGDFRGSRGCVAVDDDRLCSSNKLYKQVHTLHFIFCFFCCIYTNHLQIQGQKAHV